MSEKVIKQNNKKDFLIAIAICFVVGLLVAFLVTREPAAYVASMTSGVLVIFCLFPLILILFICAIVAAIQDKTKYTLIFLMCCVLLPGSFFVSLKIIEFAGLARYQTSGLNEMRSFETDSSKGIVIVFKKDVNYEQIENFTNKTLEEKEFGNENIICETEGMFSKEKYWIQTIWFCRNISQEKKDKIKEILKASSIVYKFYENVKRENIKDLP